MAKSIKLYGSLDNRLSEGKNYTGRELKVGDDITMYYWSDRTCYYITKVVNQKHIFVQSYKVVADRDKEGGMGHQNWVYFKTEKECNEYLKKYGLGHDDEIFESPDQEWVFRYRNWWVVSRNAQGEPRYHKIDRGLSFGVRDYYYDWEF